MIDALVTLLPGARRPLPTRSKVLFHIGTRQQEATCVLVGANGRLEPGQQALSQLRFELPVVALPSDRFILRGFHKQENYGTTLGGGTVLRVLTRRLRPRHVGSVELLGRVQQAHQNQDIEERVSLELESAGAAGLTRVELQQRLPYVPSRLERVLQQLLSRRRAVRFDNETGATIHADHFDHLSRRLLEIVSNHHRDQPLVAGIGREELRSRLGGVVSLRLFARLLSELEGKGKLVVEREICRLAEHTVQAAATEIRPLADRIVQAYHAAGLGPPREATLPAELGASRADVGAAIKLLIDEGELVKVADLYFARRHLETLQTKLVGFLEENGQISAPQFKELVGQSRKFVIPLAEYFDAQKVTLRVGEFRKLRA
jgi:selenocysteine-specific elongation factor